MFRAARQIVEHAVSDGATPAAVAEVGRAAGPVWTTAAGRLTWDPTAPLASAATIFDLASLTKVLATTAIAYDLVSSGRLDLAAPVQALLATWNAADRLQVTVGDLLEHASGLPAYRPYYKQLAGREAFEKAIAVESLDYAPRTTSVYSDLGFILLGFILEDAGGARLDHQFNRWRDEALGPGAEIRYRPPPTWAARAAPTELDPWRGRPLCNEVHDQNAAALGGVAAHAGLFGTAAAVGAAARWWLARLAAGDATVRRFVTRSPVPASSRAIAWDTMLPTSSCGRGLSAAAIGHTGFTGTSLWIDPAQDLYVVLLTNRVHPSRLNDRIQPVRRAFHDAIVDGLLSSGHWGGGS